MEVYVLNLGEPQGAAGREKPTLLELLDILFSKKMEPAQKKETLENTFDIPMTKKMETEMETMRDARYAFELEAEERGIAQGIAQGVAQGRKSMLYDLVRRGRMTIEDAAQEVGLTPQSFELDMKAYEEDQSSALGAAEQP